MIKNKEFEMDLSFERSFLPTRSSNIKIVVWVEGKIEDKVFQDAITKLASKHPLLRSKIVIREDGTSYLTTKGGKQPKVIIKNGISDKEILNAIYQEDIQPANWESDPISRFILLKGTDGINVIVVYIHHTISDGRAVTFVTNHLLEFIANSDKQVDPLKPISLTTNAPPDVKIPGILKPLMNIINKKWKKEKVIFSPQDFIEVAKKRFENGSEEYLDYSLSEEQTCNLIAEAHKQGVSVNAVLLASSIIAKNQFDESKMTPNKVGFAVDVRSRLTEDAGESCSLLASGSMIKPKIKGKMGLWDLSKIIHEETQKALKSNKKLFIRRVISPLMDPTIGDALYMAQNGWEGTPFIRSMLKKGKKIPVGVVLTNLGGTKLMKEYSGDNPLNLKDAIFYPPVGIENVIELGASTLSGKLHVVSVSKHGSDNSKLKDKIIAKIIEILLKNIM